ncbi:DNA-directed RNA polymerase III subunit RPC7-like isoform X2 [Artemia franciscana]|uniref:DNA-directed RNA polymerase III subunit RPC7-like isoform X2 n=1 Tax=Artemia franciscana TaxID=6661 RepID=UPI0032DAA3D7
MNRGRGRGRFRQIQTSTPFEPPSLYPPLEFSAGFPRIDHNWIGLVDAKKEIELRFDVNQKPKEQDIDWDLFPSCLRPSTKRTIEKKTPKKSKQKEIGSILSKLEKKDEEGDESEDEETKKKKMDEEGDEEDEENEDFADEFEEGNDYIHGLMVDDDEEFGEDLEKEYGENYYD